MKKKRELHHDWTGLGSRARGDYEIDIAAGTVRVWDDTYKGKPARWRKYRLSQVYKQLIHAAYEDGRKDRLPFQSAT
jgi:hypothetical protein